MSSFAELAGPGVADAPVYETGRPIEAVARERGFVDPDAIVKLASNENALGPSPRAVEAMHAAAAGMHRYPDGGCHFLKAALAARLDVAPSQVLPGNGSNEILELLSHVFLAPGTSVVVAERAFVVYRLLAAARGAEVITVPMRDFAHDLPAMAKAVLPSTRLLFVANPNNPTGTSVEADAVEALMECVPKRTVVCFDEAYIELLPPDRRPQVLRYVREGRLVVVVRTFSKAYGLAGLRLGYAVAPEECIRLLNRVRQPFNVNAMAQAAALAALEDEEHLARTRAMAAEGARFLERAFGGMGLNFVPTTANFILVQVGRGRAVFEALQERGVIVRPMDGYGLPEYVRVTVGTHRENERCVAALRAVLAGT